MKKVAIFLAAIALTTGVFAQVAPTTPIKWFAEKENLNVNNLTQEQIRETERQTGIRRDTSPIAPATLLLLGLGGAVVGTKVVRNRKK